MEQQNKQSLDIVVFGATSFVGQLICHYLSSLKSDFTWGIAGRSEAKLNALKSTLALPDLATFVADVADPDAIGQIPANAKVVISTVGPYALYGEPMLKACVLSGTDYLDLTGEPQWIYQMQDKYEAIARETGARIVCCSGFDSIPSDLGVYYLQQQAQAKFHQPCQHVAMRVLKLRGGASGGTIASMLNIVEQLKQQPSLRKVLTNPFALCPKGHGFKKYQPVLKKARFDSMSQRWIAPFVMAAINTRVVHRTNALLDNLYGDEFVYEEAMSTGKGFQGAKHAYTMALGLGAFMFASTLSPIRDWLKDNYLPKPGEGPSPEEQEKGHYHMAFYGFTCDGQQLTVEVKGDRDPGYGSTAKLISQAALGLLTNTSLTEQGGFYTPAAIFKETLYPALETQAGLTFTLKE